MDTHDVTRAAREAGDHPVVEMGARLGYAVNGLLHLLIAWLAIQLAIGSSSSTADQSGALGALAGQTWGLVLLWVVVVGFALLAAWQLVDAIGGWNNLNRLKAAAKAVVYALLAVSAFNFTRGQGQSSSAQSVDVTARLMNAPAGRALVVGVGLVVIGVAAYHVYKGVRRTFLKDLRQNPGNAAEKAGMIGYVAKGIALLVVGGLFVLAGLRNSPGEATGLDGALRQLSELPFGMALLIIVGIGLAAYGVYSFARAKYAKV